MQGAIPVSLINTNLTAPASKSDIALDAIIVKAAALALRAVPEANSGWHDTFMRQHASADIAVAVATDGGISMPVIAKADSKGAYHSPSFP